MTAFHTTLEGSTDEMRPRAACSVLLRYARTRLVGPYPLLTYVYAVARQLMAAREPQ